MYICSPGNSLLWICTGNVFVNLTPKILLCFSPRAIRRSNIGTALSNWRSTSNWWSSKSMYSKPALSNNSLMRFGPNNVGLHFKYRWRPFSLIRYEQMDSISSAGQPCIVDNVIAWQSSSPIELMKSASICSNSSTWSRHHCLQVSHIGDWDALRIVLMNLSTIGLLIPAKL